MSYVYKNILILLAIVGHFDYNTKYMKIDEVTIGAALKAARQKAGLTQSDVAKKFSVSPQAVGYWEVGKTSPSLVNLAKLSRLYKAPTDALLGLGKGLHIKQSPRILESERGLSVE